MPKSTKAKKKVIKPKTKVASRPKSKVVSKPKIAAAKGPIKISKTYVPKDTENICVKNIKFFLELSLMNGKRN